MSIDKWEGLQAQKLGLHVTRRQRAPTVAGCGGIRSALLEGYKSQEFIRLLRSNSFLGLDCWSMKL